MKVFLATEHLHCGVHIALLCLINKHLTHVESRSSDEFRFWASQGIWAQSYRQNYPHRARYRSEKIDFWIAVL